MSKYAILLAGASLFALSFPSVFQQYQRRLATEDGVERLAAPAPTVNASLPAPARHGATTLLAGPDGHFRADARLNGRPVAVLVDTGATYVSMSEAMARRLGVFVSPADFRYEGETANGRTKIALATLDRVSIGDVEVRDVDVAIARGDGLNGVLLGMSFMGKLKRYDVSNGRLNLVR